MDVDPSWITKQNRILVTTDILGRAMVPDQAYENPDGSPLRIDTNYFGESRNSENPAPGPFRAPEEETIHLKVWPKNE